MNIATLGLHAHLKKLLFGSLRRHGKKQTSLEMIKIDTRSR